MLRQLQPGAEWCRSVPAAGERFGAAGMASDSERESDRDDSVFADCHSGNDGAAARKRQMSVPEMVRQVERKRAKRQLGGHKSRSPRERARPRATDARQPAAALSEVTLPAIEQLIEAGNARIIEALEKRFAQQERRIEILEAECQEKDATITQIRREMICQKEEIKELQEKIDGIDRNRRMSSLIITCEEFGDRKPGEDIERMTVQVLNKRFPDMKLTTGDIQVAHRLQGNGKVVAKFVKRTVRDELFERRFELVGRRGGGGSGRWGASGGREMAALYLNESLTPESQRMYNMLLTARKQDGGAKVTSVFTRRGYVYCRKVKGGENIRIQDWSHLQRIVHGSPGGPPALAAAAAGVSGGLPVRDRAEPHGPRPAREERSAARPGPAPPLFSGRATGEPSRRMVAAGAPVPGTEPEASCSDPVGATRDEQPGSAGTGPGSDGGSGSGSGPGPVPDATQEDRSSCAPLRLVEPGCDPLASG